MPKPAHAVAALLTVVMTMTTWSALAARTLDVTKASDVALTQALKDKHAEETKYGGVWATPEVSCRRRAAVWFVCRTVFGQSQAGNAHPVLCRRTVDVRLRAGRPDPVLTRRTMTCKRT